MQRKNKSEKSAIKKDLKLLEKSLRGELLRLEGKIERSDENAEKYKDEILAKMDEVMGELGVMREDNTIGSGQTSQLREQVEDHDKRIKNLEKAQHTT